MTSIIKVDNLQNQCGANIINENAGTITIGASGDTITLAAGASQSGFGRSGSVNWDTTPKTANFTAVSGEGYFVDTTLGAITATLPAGPSAGDIVAIADYNGTAITNNITIGRNSSDINGSATDLTINANYSAVTLVYVDATSGWRSVDSSNPNDIIAVPEYVAATGGTVTCCGDYKIHTFTGPGTFTVTNAGNPLGSETVDYMVVAGGGSGGTEIGGGGGAGGFRESVPSPAAWTASPLANPGGALPVSVQGYPIVVGSGGAGTAATTASNPGNPSTFSSITSTGGGRGGTHPGVPGADGGSGGGGAYSPNVAGSGNTPPVSPPQGNNGGAGVGIPSPPSFAGGGGGGATVAGSVGTIPTGGPGGNGATTSISGSPTAYAGGGGGSGSINNNQPGGTGGSGGGGTGARNSPVVAATNGGTNLGGGGGGSPNGPSGGAPGTSGGSGIVIIRYKYQ